MTEQTRKIRPDELKIFDQIPGIAAVARDQDLRLFWSTPSCQRVPGKDGEAVSLMGTMLEDVISEQGASERNEVHRRVMETGQAESHYRMSLGTRVLCTVFPLDEGAFGHRGIFAVSVDAAVGGWVEGKETVPILSTPNLHELSVLSSRELEVVHYVAKGMSTNDIAETLCRANKTVEHHVNSIHGKLGTHSRAELVRFVCERGIQSFSDQEWLEIVAGARAARKELV